MKITKLKSVSDNLKKYDYLAKDSDYITVTEWLNDKGYDISISDNIFSLSEGQLDVINYLTQNYSMKSLTIKIPERTKNIKFTNDIDINRDFSIILVGSNEECFRYTVSDSGQFIFCQTNSITDSEKYQENLYKS